MDGLLPSPRADQGQTSSGTGAGRGGQEPITVWQAGALLLNLLSVWRKRERASFEEIVRAVEKAREAKRSERLGRHGDPGKWIVLRLARHFTRLTLAELGREIGAVSPSWRTMDYAAVRAGLRWFEQKKRDKLVKDIERRACDILNL